MDKSIHEEHLFQPLQTNNKHFKIAVTFLTVYNGIFNLTDKNNKFYFKKSITDDDGFIQTTVPPGAYNLKKLNNEIKRIIINEEQYTESKNPFPIKPNFSKFGSKIQTSTEGPVITFVPDDSIRDLLGLNKTTIYEGYNLSHNPVDILSFDNKFLECVNVQGMIFRCKRCGIILTFTMDVDPG